MTEKNQRLGDAGKRLRVKAGDLARNEDFRSRRPTTSASAERTIAPRLTAAAAAIAVVGLGVVGLAVVGGGGDSADVDSLDSSAPTSLGATTVPQTFQPQPTAPESQPASTLGEESILTTTEPALVADAALTRPAIDPAICEPIQVLGAGLQGLPLHPGSLPLTPFGRPSSNDIPIQVVGHPGEQITGQFAVVERIESEQPVAVEGAINIDGRAVQLSRLPGGDLEASWDVDSVSQGYIRARGFDEDLVANLISSLVPRSVDAEVAGFDLVGPVASLEILHEALNTSISGDGVGSVCAMASTGFAYRVWVVNGDAVYQFVSAIDRPRPVDVQEDGDSIVFVSGPAGPSAPTAAQVVNLGESEWQKLADNSLAGTTDVEAQIDQPFALQLDGLGSEIADQTLTATIRREAGALLLEVDASTVLLSDGSRFWVAAVNGRGGISRAGAGGLLGYRISDDPDASSFPLSISAVDEDGLALQSTGRLEVSLNQ